MRLDIGPGRLCLLVVTWASVGCADDAPVPDLGNLPSLFELEDGWNRLAPEGETACSDGSDYSFFVRPGDLKLVAIYLQGGGACWFGEICDRDVNPTYDPVVDDRDHPSSLDGMFDLDNPENPMAAYSMVFVPYCTADVHLGDSVATYHVPESGNRAESSVTIRHQGAANVMSALNWVFGNVSRPDRVFIGGSSAGAVPSAVFATVVADRFPRAEITNLADAAGGYRGGNVAEVLAGWGVSRALPPYDEFAELDPAELNFEKLLIAAAERAPDVTFAQYNAAEDQVQLRFLELAGVSDTHLQPLLYANHRDIRNAVPNFRSFTAGGDTHTILATQWFYTYEAGGRRFLDWFGDLVAGHDVNDVQCLRCDRPKFYFTVTDLEIIQRAKILLSGPAAWNRQDERECGDDDAARRYSLYCALHRASRDVTGTYVDRRSALEAARYAVEDVTDGREFEHRLRDFNNLRTTRFADVKSLLDGVENQILGGLGVNR